MLKQGLTLQEKKKNKKVIWFIDGWIRRKSFERICWIKIKNSSYVMEKPKRKKSAIKQLKFEDNKNCLESTELENWIKPSKEK